MISSFLKKLNRVAENRWFPLVLIPIGVLFLLVYSFSTSPLYVDEGWDSNIFKEIGLAITKGKLLYVDIFDHKGPIIFLLNALGQSIIPGRNGIFLLQVIFMSAVLVYLFKTARLFLNGLLSFVAVIIVLGIYGGIMYEGNLGEEWGLIAIVVALYYSLRYLQNSPADSPVPHPYALSVLYGVCFSWVFYIRPNDAVSMVGGVMAGIFLYLLFTRQFKNAIFNALFFLGTFIVLSLPFIIYFASKDALDAYYYGLIGHNSMYTEGFLPLVKACFGKKKLMFFQLFLAMNVMVAQTSDRRSLFVLIPVSLFAWVLTGWLMFNHYAISFIPLFLLFWAFMFRQKNIGIVMLSLALFYCCSFGGQLDYIYGFHDDTIRRVEQLRTHDQDNRNFYEESRKLLDVVPEDERDSIWNLNLIWDKHALASVFFHNGLVQCNRIIHYPHYQVDPNLKETDNIWTGKPKWVLMTHSFDHHAYWNFDFTRDYDYLEQHYEFVAATDSTVCNLELYRRK